MGGGRMSPNAHPFQALRGPPATTAPGRAPSIGPAGTALGQSSDLLREERHLLGDALADRRSHDSHVLDVERRAQGEVLELLRRAELRELVLVAAEDDEAGEIAAVGLEEHGLPALDGALLLESLVVGKRLVKDLDRLALAAVDGLTPADEDPRLRPDP